MRHGLSKAAAVLNILASTLVATVPVLVSSIVSVPTGSLIVAAGVFVQSNPVDASDSLKYSSTYSFKDALVTVGVGAAVGSVIGASTLPFYVNSSDHFGNVFLGAGLGIMASVGLALYLLTTPRDSQDQGHITQIYDTRSPKDLGQHPFLNNFESGSDLKRTTPTTILAVNILSVKF